MPEESTTPDLEGRLRGHIEAANRSDFDAALAVFSEGAAWDRSPVGQEVIEGRDAIRDFIEDWKVGFEDYVLGLEEFHDLGNGVTLGLLSHAAGHARAAALLRTVRSRCRVEGPADRAGQRVPGDRRGPCCCRTPRL